MAPRGFPAALLAACLGIPAPAAAAEICVIAPQIRSDPDGRATALVPLERPTLLVREPLVEIRLEQRGRLLWQHRAPDAALEGPIAWPLGPLRPEEQLVLRLRPQGSPVGSFATIELRAAAAGRLDASRALLHTLAADPGAWNRSIRAELASGDPSLGIALLFAFEGPGDPTLNALRQTVARQSCAPGSGAPPQRP